MVHRDAAMFLDACERLLADGCAVRFRAEGTSMLPTVADGELLLVAPVRVEDIGRGDILLCRCPAGALAHRVADISTIPGGSREFLLRGDGKLGCDAPVAAADVLGRVMAASGSGRLRRLQGPIARLRWRLRAAVPAVRRTLLTLSGRTTAVP
ncbi:MAG: S24/S26 family peptidase [Acidobacteriota bacterium]